MITYKYITVINDNSKRLDICNSYEKCKTVDEYLSITNGHDYINLYCDMCKKNNKNCSIAELEKAIRLTFGKNEFKQTKLYNQLLEYQKLHSIVIVD